MKKFINLILIFVLLFNTIILFIPSGVNAQTITATIIDKEGVNVRTGPSTSYSVAGVLNYTTTVSLVSQTKYSGSGCSGGWYRINYNGSTERYICSDLAVINGLSNADKYYTTSVWGYRINENYATVRKTGSFSAEQLDVIYLGTNVNIVGTSPATYNCDTGWYKITYYNNTKTGYVCQRLVEKYEDVTSSDAEYEKELAKLGFPKSYFPFLVNLHKKHPNWTFEAIKTNIKFDDAVTGEAGKNYIQSTNKAYIASGIPQEAGTWYTASTPVVAFYLDPRNYLNEKNIFAFEKLSYDKENHTKEVLKEMFGSSYLADDEYIAYFLKAATDFKISPVHLASRIIQEGASSITYAGGSGNSSALYDGKPLKGYYNYYNIGAYGADPVSRGLAVAAGYIKNSSLSGIPWDTREKAIYYGAKFIADDYINAGQDTRYFQKFNTSPTSTAGKYTNQYQTNIIAPASESLSTYYTYKDANKMDVALKFAIPVYNNMPDEYTKHPLVGDNNNNLKELKVDGVLVNGFDEDVLTYTHYIDYNAKSVKVSALASAKTSSVKGLGNIEIKDKETTVKIVVTSEIGEEKTYTLTLIKADEPDPIEPSLTIDEIINKVDVKVNDTYLSGIKEKTTATELANMINKQAPSAVVKITDKDNNVTSSTLKTGDKITITSGNDSKDFIIVIKGDTNGDGKVNSLDMLRIQKHILGYKKLTDEYQEACDTNYDGKINSLDMLRIQKHILKYIVLK